MLCPITQSLIFHHFHILSHTFLYFNMDDKNKNILFWNHSINSAMQWSHVKTANCIVFLLNVNCKFTSFKIVKSTFWIHNNNLLQFLILLCYVNKRTAMVFFCCHMIVNRMFQGLQLFKRTTVRSKIFLVGKILNCKLDTKTFTCLNMFLQEF